MSNDLINREARTLVDPGVFQQAMALATAMADARSLPKHLQGSPADCLRVVEMAFRTGQSPYAIADKTYFVGGKIAFEGQLCAALVNAHPTIETRLNYDYSGDETKPQSLVCIVSAKLKGENQRRTVRVTWEQGYRMSQGAKDKWQSQPAQQLAYFGARVWGRRHAPEILMGIYTPEELSAEEEHQGPDNAREINPSPTAAERRAAMQAAELVEVYDCYGGMHMLQPGEVEQFLIEQKELLTDDDAAEAFAAANREHIDRSMILGLWDEERKQVPLFPEPEPQKATTGAKQRAQEIAAALRAAPDKDGLMKTYSRLASDVTKLPDGMQTKIAEIYDEVLISFQTDNDQPSLPMRDGE